MRQAGFTLLELVVVLAVIGLLTAVALPALGTLYARGSFALERDGIERQLADLAPRAYAEGRSFVLRNPPVPGEDLSGDPIVRLDLPSGWTIDVPQPIAFRYDGLCSGGLVRVAAAGLTATYRLDPPRCPPVLADTR